MPLFSFNFDAISATQPNSLTGVVRYSTGQTQTWKIKYVGWVGEHASVLRVTLTSLVDSSNHLTFFTTSATSPNLEASPAFFDFIATSSEQDTGSTINLFGSVPCDLNLGRFRLQGSTFTVEVEARDSFGVRQEARNVVVQVEYD